jgi:hypothetical protein
MIDSSEAALRRRDLVTAMVAGADRLPIHSYRMTGSNEAKHTLEIAAAVFPTDGPFGNSVPECYIYTPGLTQAAINIMLHNLLRLRLPKHVKSRQQEFWAGSQETPEQALRRALPAFIDTELPLGFAIYGFEANGNGISHVDNAVLLHSTGVSSTDVWNSLQTAKKLNAYTFVAPPGYMLEI